MASGAGRGKRKRDFSLRRPTASQERSGQKKSACSVRNDGVGGGRAGMRKGLEIHAEVVPFGVERLDQGDFLRSPPFLDFFFTRSGRADAGMWLEPNELGDVVFLYEAGKDFFFVLADAVWQVAGHAEVEDAGLAGHEVDVEGALHWQEL